MSGDRTPQSDARAVADTDGVEDPGADGNRFSDALSRLSLTTLVDVLAIALLSVGVYGMVDRRLRLLLWHFIAVLGALWLINRVPGGSRS